MSGYFIAATGTDIGKTLLTSTLAYQLRMQGRAVRAIKPVASGFDEARQEASDTGILLAAQGLPLSRQSVEAISPWRFAAPLSPDMAAADEGREIDFSRLVAFCCEHQGAETLLVESAGGIMTPLDETHTMLDLAVALGFPVILVTGSYLGTLSHTLTALGALDLAGLTLAALAISESPGSPVPLVRMETALRRFLRCDAKFFSIPRLDSLPELWKYAPDLTPAIAL
jgi:dethiobiotin synthetase